MATMRDFEGKSFAWAFWLAAAMFSCGAWWGEVAGLGRGSRAVLLVVAGCVPLAIQLITGHGLDGAWVARFTKSGSPGQYRRSMTVAMVAAVASGLGAWLFLVGPGSG
ncbi:hypothetical protein ACFONC_00770 [Luteimonas soli]|uniref:Uncharacterized protein n=1 Tax=Luteimonas soli TaxID=1648966 RepID=A0ABV7XEU0_9GAMM